MYFSLTSFLLLTLVGVVFSAVCPCSNTSLCQPIKTPPRKELFIFGSSDYKSYNWDKITTLAWWGDSNFDPMVVCYAHERGARVTYPVFFNANQLSNTTAKNQFIQNSLSLVKERFLDGVNFDFEDAIPSGDVNAKLLTELTQQLTDTFHKEIPGSQVTFDVGWSPACIDIRCYDYASLATVTDFLFVMAYDEQSQIFGPCRAGPTSDYRYLIQGLSLFIKIGIPPEKLVAGLPWYGHNYPCLNPTNVTVCPLEFYPWRGVECTDAGAPEYSYKDIMNTFLPISTTGRQWDEDSKSPWLNYNDKNGVRHQIWYDDPESLTAKVQWAKEVGKVGGVGMFTADYLNYTDSKQSNDFWMAMNNFFT